MARRPAAVDSRDVIILFAVASTVVAKLPFIFFFSSDVVVVIVVVIVVAATITPCLVYGLNII